MNVRQLAQEFKALIRERDRIIDTTKKYTQRCQIIDDVEIPEILDQIPREEMRLFNELIN